VPPLYRKSRTLRYTRVKDSADARQLLASFFDGLCGAVVGVIAIIAAQILKSSVEGSPRNDELGGLNSAALNRISHTGSAAVIYVVSLGVLYKFTNKFTPLLLLVSGAVAGQMIFV